ncbi:ATP-binding cassette domain-containing protein [Thermoanaerobacterium thermosaccharolyticum]|uniref:ABC transporter ATP-binding protein n=1 Tax=Thermoanaerobacterium thermosaccharolyticum TaxID=1517 RepID=UPI0027A8C010|nr:ATP-binding cassette domain-containing protein [Thermoanaerobacterium thermosaccharolyticum]
MKIKFLRANKNYHYRNQFLNIIVDIFKVIFIGIAVFSINIYLAVIVIATFLFSYFVFLKYGKILKEKNKETAKVNDDYFSDMQESISGIREIKGLGIKNERFNTFMINSIKLKNKIININIISNLSQILSQSINIISQILIMLTGGYLISRNLLSIEYFVAFSSYSNQFSASLMNITKINSYIQQIMVSLKRIFDIMDNLSYSKQEFGNKNIEHIDGDIKFANINFKYDKNNKLILRNISFKIPKNSKIAIVGSSGVGKTTILNLILRFYEPLSGEIFIHDINIKEFDEESLRRHIAIVKQQPYLFNGTIKENLLIVNRNASDEDIKRVCKAAYLHDYIMSLPKKYDSIVGENGINLSGGQKQRLAIARALLKDAKIILFDETTSELDNESQEYIKKSITKISENHTVVIVAHRLFNYRYG